MIFIAVTFMLCLVGMGLVLFGIFGKDIYGKDMANMAHENGSAMLVAGVLFSICLKVTGAN